MNALNEKNENFIKNFLLDIDENLKGKYPYLKLSKLKIKTKPLILMKPEDTTTLDFTFVGKKNNGTSFSLFFRLVGYSYDNLSNIICKLKIYIIKKETGDYMMDDTGFKMIYNNEKLIKFELLY